MPESRRKRRWVVAAAIGAVVLALGLALFKPWLLFIDVRVDEQLPTVVASPSPEPTAAPSKLPSGAPTRPPARPVQLAQGRLISHEHATSGTVRIVQQPGGKRILTLENLDTSNGPDVHVWLSAADVVEGTAGWFTAGSAEHYDLGVIKGNQGNQVYAIPGAVDLARYRSVDLWCEQFSVSFGAAQLGR